MINALLIIIASCVIIWRSSHGFELAADYLGRKLPAGIKGATINAIASSMPEFLTTLFFLFWLRDAGGFSGGLAVSSGSALFNLLIIPAGAVLMLSALRTGQKITLNKKVLMREGAVLLLSQILFISFLGNEKLGEKQGLSLVGIYAAYLILLFFVTRKRRIEDPGFETPVQEKLLPWAWRALSLDVSNTVLDGRPVNRTRAWVLLGVSTAVMTLGTWLLVLGTEVFWEKTGIPMVFVSVVLSAAATSVPDTILSLKDARKGNYDDALSNALGSNIFDIAFALGLPIFLYNLVYNEGIRLEPEALKFTREVWVFLLMATFVALLVMLIGKFFTRTKAWILLLIYVAFLIFVGTQVQEGWSGIGTHIGNFLETIAEWIGRLLYNY